jgi:hypothetical protein
MMVNVAASLMSENMADGDGITPVYAENAFRHLIPYGAAAATFSGISLVTS